MRAAQPSPRLAALEEVLAEARTLADAPPPAGQHDLVAEHCLCNGRRWVLAVPPDPDGMPLDVAALADSLRAAVAEGL